VCKVIFKNTSQNRGMAEEIKNQNNQQQDKKGLKVVKTYETVRVVMAMGIL
jgi:hypothetical protein